MYKLLLLEHNLTKLKYLCKTVTQNPSYKGSGKYWKAHLKKYGRDVNKTILYETENLEDFKRICEHYSNILNVVESKDFANLKIENGMDGGDTYSNLSDLQLANCKNKISLRLKKYHKNRPMTHNLNISNGRKSMSDVSKFERKCKIQKTYSTGKHETLFKKYSIERRGQKNPAAQKISVENKIFNCIKDAMEELKLTRSVISNRLNSNNEKWKNWFRIEHEDKIY